MDFAAQLHIAKVELDFWVNLTCLMNSNACIVTRQALRVLRFANVAQSFQLTWSAQVLFPRTDLMMIVAARIVRMYARKNASLASIK